MTDQTNSTPNLYALLIGINCYLERPDLSLGGCVRDVNLVEEYLQRRNPAPTKIFKLTATHSSASEAEEPKELLPTYKNIVAQFQQLTAIAKKGDLVYIHYSGHGGRIKKTKYPELKTEQGSDEALVPTDIGIGEGQYLFDVELAYLLQQMVNKGLVVTFVLDSCHSGGATRGEDAKIRGVNENFDTTPRPIKSLVASDEELKTNWLALTEGTPHSPASGSWLQQATDYVVLAACRPSEYAHEYPVDGKEWRGALTHWWLETLKSSRSRVTYRQLYERISAKIQSRFANLQMPMLLGDGNRTVFDSVSQSLQYAVNVLEVVGSAPKQVKLNVGQAQGVSKGARFAIYPLSTTDFTQKQNILAIAEVTEVTGSDSWATVIEILGKEEIEQGSQALMQSAPVELVKRVRLFVKLEGDKENELPQSLVGIQHQALESVKKAIEGNGWLKLVTDDQQAADYLVAVNRNGEYEICAKTTPIVNLRPALKVGESSAAHSVVKRLVHLVKYYATLEIGNPDSDLTNKLEVRLLKQVGWQPGMKKEPESYVDIDSGTVTSGEYVFLQITNLSSQDFNVAGLNIQSDWAISQLSLQGQTANFYFLGGKDKILTPFRMKVRNGYEKVTDSFKVFATVGGGANFQWLELPSLDEEIKSRNKTKQERTTAAQSSLGRLLDAISTDVDDHPPTREAESVSEPNQEWTTKTVQINVKAV